MTAASLATRVIAADQGEGLKLLRGSKVPGVSREFFERVVELAGSDPQAARRAVSKWPVFYKAGDEPAYALRARGVGERLEGRWLQSAESFLAAGRLATNAVDNLAFSVGAIDSLARSGKVAEALRLGRSMARKLAELGESGVAAKIFLNLGNALLWQDRYREARHLFEQAISHLADQVPRVEGAAAQLGLSTSHLFSGDPQEAIDHALAAKATFLQLGSKVHAATCDMNAAHAAILIGQADRAVEIILECGPAFESLPAEAANAREFLGDAYLRLNQWDEAMDSFEEALSHRSVLPPANIANCLLGLGLARAALQNTSKARRHLAAAASAYERLGILPWQASALSALARLEVAVGRLTTANRLAVEAVEVGRRGGSSYHRAVALLAASEVLTATGQDASALLGEASRIVARNRFIGLAWEVPYLRALSASGRVQLRLLRRSYRLILEHRLLTTSVASRMSFLRDKEGVLRALIGKLLANPTPSHVREVIGVVESTRSIALLDEIASSSSSDLSPSVVRRLQELRRQLASDPLEVLPGDPMRRSRVAHPSRSAVRREWLELTRTIISPKASPSAGSSQDSVIFVDAGAELYALNGRRAIPLGMGQAELLNAVGWLRFELLSPMVTSAEEGPILASLERLAQILVRPWLRHGSLRICPTGSLWQVPWAALIRAFGSDQEPILCLHPSAQPPLSPHGMYKNGRVCLWISRASNLPYVKHEADVLRRLFPDVTIIESAAGARDSLRSQSYEILHVAAHAGHEPSNPMFSYLEFEDGRVYATEIARSSFSASFVNLSACDTATVSTPNPSEPDGLARAFLARGAEAVLGSMWPLNDEASLVFNERFYTELSYSKGIVGSLGIAREGVGNWRSHPFYWAPFVLFGGYHSKR